MAGETPTHHHQDPQTPSSIHLPGRLRSAEKNPPRVPQRGHLLVAACHCQSTAAAHPPTRLPKAQWLLKESCTVPATTSCSSTSWALSNAPLSPSSCDNS